jgi:AraC-like DNA-binding protein
MKISAPTPPLGSSTHPVAPGVSAWPAAEETLPSCLGDWRLRARGGTAAARCQLRPFDGVAVGDVHLGACSARRTGGRPDLMLVSYVLGGAATACIGTSRRQLRAGDLSVWPTLPALNLHVPQSLHVLAVALPAERGRERVADAAAVLRIGRDEPVGQMLAGFFEGLSRSFGQLDERQGALAISMVRALLDQCLQGHQAAQAASAPPLLTRVLAYGEANLGDPELTPQRIADAHGISLRSLQILFEREGLRVAEWIRDQRLVRCRDMLAQPGWDGRIIDVAMQWGFNSPSHFSRLFRQRFGRAPRQARAQARIMLRSAR